MTDKHHFTLHLLETSSGQREEVYAEVRDSHRMRPAYLTMLVLACLVATLGLLSNSTAVVIGAMLISPLMSPFLSAGLALALGDWELGKAAVRTIALSVVGAVVISATAVAVSPLREATAEIVARTNPNLLDLGIAFFSGFAGTYTLVSRKGLTTIPGVAIATAVMPPLCVVGFGVYHMDARIAGGAFSLFFTNLAGIVISAATVFWLASFRAAELPGKHWAVSTRLTVSFLILGGLSIPLATAMVKAAELAQIRRAVGRALAAEIERDATRARLVAGWTLRDLDDGAVEIDATVRTVSYFTQKEVEAIDRTLQATAGRRVELSLDQVLVKHGGLDAPVEAGPLKVNEGTVLAKAVAAYRPAAELAATVLGATFDRYAVATDGTRLQWIDLYATRDSFPDAALVAAARRAVRDEIPDGPLAVGPSGPDLVLHLRPPLPIDLPRTGLRPTGGKLISSTVETVRAFLIADPALTVRVRLGDADAAPEDRAALARLLGISESRLVAATAADFTGIDIRLIEPEVAKPSGTPER